MPKYGYIKLSNLPENFDMSGYKVYIQKNDIIPTGIIDSNGDEIYAPIVEFESNGNAFTSGQMSKLEFHGSAAAYKAKLKEHTANKP